MDLVKMDLSGGMDNYLTSTPSIVMAMGSLMFIAKMSDKTSVDSEISDTSSLLEITNGLIRETKRSFRKVFIEVHEKCHFTYKG